MFINYLLGGYSANNAIFTCDYNEFTSKSLFFIHSYLCKSKTFFYFLTYIYHFFFCHILVVLLRWPYFKPEFHATKVQIVFRIRN